MSDPIYLGPVSGRSPLPFDFETLKPDYAQVERFDVQQSEWAGLMVRLDVTGKHLKVRVSDTFGTPILEWFFYKS